MADSKIATTFKELLGEQGCLFDQEQCSAYFKNIYNHPYDGLGVVLPETEQDVVQIITQARRLKIPLYPISTGKNWGLGSQLPVQNRHLVVDFKRMNRILEYDARLGSIRIQPGVTQSQIHQHLKANGGKFFLNVTGSTKDSSVVGNSLERGIAHYGCRVAEITALEVILGTGKKLSTGGGVFAGSDVGGLYKYGLGADLTGLFSQSAFGIVTSLTIRLQPVQDETVVVTIRQGPQQSLAAFVDELMTLRQKSLLPTNLHISNFARRISILTPLLVKHLELSFEKAHERAVELTSVGWAATASLTGDSAIIATQLRQIKRSIKTASRFSSMSRLQIENGQTQLDQVMAGPFLHADGVPSDDAILSLGFEQSELLKLGPVDSQSGTLFVVPLTPALGSDVQHMIAIIDEQFTQSEFTPYITLNLVENTCFEAVVNLVFDRNNPEKMGVAQQTVLSTMKALQKNGFPPLRLSIFQMPHVEGLQSSHLQALKELKKVFDPDAIISLGRYQWEVPT